MGHKARPLLAALLIGAVLCASAVRGGEEPLPDHRLGLRTAPLLLLTRPDVRDDLALDPKQAADAERAIAVLFSKAAALRGKQGPAAVAARREIDTAMESWLESRLSVTQYNRLVEIDLQWEGPAALISRPVAADHLGLTADQRKGLAQAVGERNKQRATNGFREGDEDRLARRALAILTPEQRDRWKAMLGRPFTPRLAGSKSNPPR